jgi:hypothetical protein
MAFRIALFAIRNGCHPEITPAPQCPVSRS